MKAKILLLSLLTVFTINVKAQTQLISTVNAMSNDDLWTALLNVNLNNETVFAKCKISDATTCASCACDYYFRSNQVGTLGMYGWPKNPASGDSTGCDNGTRWGGYSAAMATSDLKANARAMLLDALNNNACGIPTPVVTTDSLNVSETAKFKFVDPNQTGGTIKCGSTNLGPQIAGSPQFTKLSDDFCLAAYYMALKAQANSGAIIDIISLSIYNNYNTLAQSTLNVVPTAGQLNQSYGLLELGNSNLSIQPLVDTSGQLNTLTPTAKYIFNQALLSLGINPDIAVPTLNQGCITCRFVQPTDAQKAAIDSGIATFSTQTVQSLNVTTIDQSLTTTRTAAPAL